MFDKGLFGGMFDFNNDGKLDSFEKAAEFATFMHIVDETEKDNVSSGITFGSSLSIDDDDIDEVDEALSSVGLDRFDLEMMDDDERAEALEDAGLDPDDFDF